MLILGIILALAAGVAVVFVPVAICEIVWRIRERKRAAIRAAKFAEIRAKYAHLDHLNPAL